VPVELDCEEVSLVVVPVAVVRVMLDVPVIDGVSVVVVIELVNDPVVLD
jgi:hypothetical protein